MLEIKPRNISQKSEPDTSVGSSLNINPIPPRFPLRRVKTDRVDHDLIMMTSGIGQFHTNEPDPDKPDKKLKPYFTITLADIRALVDSPQEVPKRESRWFIPSTLLSRNFAKQEAEGSFVMLWADFDNNPWSLTMLSVPGLAI